MSGHGFTRRPRNMKGKIRGGMAVGCMGCSWMTVLPLGTPVPQMLKAHHDHIASAVSTDVEPTRADLAAQLADLSSKLESVIG